MLRTSRRRSVEGGASRSRSATTSSRSPVAARVAPPRATPWAALTVLASLALAACATPDDPLPPPDPGPVLPPGTRAIATIEAVRPLEIDAERVTVTAPPAPPTGIRLAERGGAGPFHVVLNHVEDGAVVRAEHPSRDWICERKVASATEELGAIQWIGCRVPDIDEDGDGRPERTTRGDFDVTLTFVPEEDGALAFDVLVDNRMDVPMETFRFVLRIDPATLGSDPSQVYAYFGLDEWIEDPVRAMASDRVDRRHAFVRGGAYLDESATSGFYANRLNPRPMLSIHTPEWGLLVHERDPDNAVPGELLLGSNDGSLELGYQLRMPMDRAPGNGGEPIRIGAGFRAVTLPANARPEDAWTEAALAYRAYALEAGLLPEETLAESPFPAAFAHDCLYQVFNIAPDASGRVPVDHWADFARRSIRFYARGVTARDDDDAATADVQQRRFCPLLWGWSDVGPYAPHEGVLELLERFAAIADEEGVEIYPLVYVLSGLVEGESARGTFLDEAMVRDPSGAIVNRSVVPILASHPAFAEHVLDTVDRMYAHGVRGVYFDAPFGEHTTDYRLGGDSRLTHAGIRTLMRRAAERLTELGGGVITSEQSRIGLGTVQGFNGLSNPVVWGSRFVPLGAMLWHDRHLGGYFGDLASEWITIVTADASADSVYATCAECEPGLPDNMRHVHRLAIEGAVYGAAGVDMPPIGGQGLFDYASTGPFAEVFRFADVSLRNALAARRRIRALRTGRMLPLPAHDIEEVEVGYRPLLDLASHPRVLRRVHAATPAALYEDVEAPGTFALVVGNPSDEEALVHFHVDTRAYAAMGGRAYVATAEDGDELARGRTLSIEARVPPHDIRAVTLEAVR